MQAYSKRSLPLIDWLAEVAQVTGRRLPVRLVKGAYWDSEIKWAQQAGLADYPVFTRKVNIVRHCTDHGGSAGITDIDFIGLHGRH